MMHIKTLLVLLCLIGCVYGTDSIREQFEQQRMAVDYILHTVGNVFSKAHLVGQHLQTMRPLAPQLPSNGVRLMGVSDACSEFFDANKTRLSNCLDRFDPSNFTSVQRYCNSPCVQDIKNFLDELKTVCLTSTYARENEFFFKTINEMRFYLDVPCLKSQDGTLCFSRFQQWIPLFNIDFEDPVKNKSRITNAVLDQLCNDRCFPAIARVLSNAPSGVLPGGSAVVSFGRVMELMCLRDKGQYCLVYMMNRPAFLDDSNGGDSDNGGANGGDCANGGAGDGGGVNGGDCDNSGDDDSPLDPTLINQAVNFLCGTNCFRRFLSLVLDLNRVSVGPTGEITAEPHAPALQADTGTGTDTASSIFSFIFDKLCLQDPRDGSYCIVRVLNSFQAAIQPPNPCVPAAPEAGADEPTCAGACRAYAQSLVFAQGCCGDLLSFFFEGLGCEPPLNFSAPCTIPEVYIVKVGFNLRNLKFEYFQTNNASRDDFIAALKSYFSKISGVDVGSIKVFLKQVILSTSLQAANEGVRVDAEITPPSLSLASSLATDVANNLRSSESFDFTSAIPAGALVDPLAGVSVDTSSVDVNSPPDPSSAWSLSASLLVAVLVSLMAALLL